MNVTALFNITQPAQLTIENVTDYIQANGLMVSNRWRIGEETGSGGKLVFRDVLSSIVLGMDSRYTIDPSTKKDL